MQRGFSLVLILVVLGILSAIGAGSFYLFNKQQLSAMNKFFPSGINSFEECAKKYPVLESYPEQCNTPDGKHFVKELNPVSSQKMMSPMESSDESCIQNKKELFASSRFLLGDILVGFKEKDLDGSKKIISDYGLKTSTEFESINVLLVKVNDGEEFKWLCVLEKDPKVKYVELNMINSVN